ncbi:MAG: M949_RS01915 family surface polysaccharide biosynthesis protein [Sphingobacteriaceae bacterium]
MKNAASAKSVKEKKVYVNMFNYTFTLLFLFCISFYKGQLNFNPIDSTKVPKGISYKGAFKNALQFNDANGQQVIVLSETGLFSSKDNEDNRNASVYANLYSVNTISTSLLWTIKDHVKDCPVDVVAQFIPQSLSVTDLNKNKVAEVWVMYKLVCHGDVSPCDMKIIMYEGKQKFAMRGRNKVEYEPNKFEGGEYTFDKAFQSTSKEIKDFAIELWKKNIVEKWQND